ncbi:hypothetical protein AB0D14_36085 [Streptomyces sp. NPDC048484]|uniref:hypothetical protein n=1 Tax=Streptomyces sp. NPDC048484 TaxID=3155146 RepID=UPI00343F2BD9
MVQLSKDTSWQAATGRAREFYVLDSPPGGLLALMLHLIAAREETAVDGVPLAKARYELGDPAALHESLNTHCPPIAMPEDPASLLAVPNWPRHPAADPVQMRRAWLLANASGPYTSPMAWPDEAEVIEYPLSLGGDAFFPRAVDSLRGALDKALLAQVGGLPLASEARLVGGPDDGLQGRVAAVVWDLDNALRCVTVPASYRIYGPRVDAHFPAGTVRPHAVG